MKDEAGDYALNLYNTLSSGDWSYDDALARNPSPLARDFWAIPEGNNTLSMTEVDADASDDQELALLKEGDSFEQSIYLYNAPVTGDWTYWDADGRNPSPLARDFWSIPAGNDTAFIADGGSYITAMKNEGGDYNLYLYDSPYPGDWTYWDAASRNPSPNARDLWVITQGNDAVAMCGLDTIGDGESDSLLVIRDEAGDYTAYLWNMPLPGDWTYDDAIARNPSPLARDFWSIPQRNNIAGVVGVNRGGTFDELGTMEDDAGDYSLYLWNAPRPGDWVYWDASARNPSPLARDFWSIPSGNNTIGLSALK